MEKGSGNAVVIGASMGGLLAARVLSEFHERVTVVEKDTLPSGAEVRKGVPQARHAHGFLASGVAALESLEPGIGEALVGDGALQGDMSSDGIWCHGGHRHVAFESGLRGLLVSRPRLDAAVLARVRARANIRFLEHTDALGLVFVDGGRRVAGLRVVGRGKDATEEVLRADLTIDASGRGSRVPAWLISAGHEAPPVEQVEIDLRYTTRLYRRRPGDLGGRKLAVVSSMPGVPRAGVALAMEGDRWIVTTGGYGEEAPADRDGFAAYLGTLASPELSDLVREAEPLPGDAVRYRTPASVRRRYERLRRWPEGLLVLGDALCSFNPIYGQGMTVATLEATALRDLLRRGRAGLARRFFERASRIIDMAWSTAALGDLALDEVPGRRTARIRFLNWYLSKLHVAARTDRVVAQTFLAVANLCAAPGTILRPLIVSRVLRAHLRRPAAEAEARCLEDALA